MELEYSQVFRPHKRGKKEGIMLSEASISLYFECPKKRGQKGAKRVNYDVVIRYLGTPIKQINPNKKTPYDSIRNHRATLEKLAEGGGI